MKRWMVFGWLAVAGFCFGAPENVPLTTNASSGRVTFSLEAVRTNLNEVARMIEDGEMGGSDTNATAWIAANSNLVTGAVQSANSGSVSITSTNGIVSLHSLNGNEMYGGIWTDGDIVLEPGHDVEINESPIYLRIDDAATNYVHSSGSLTNADAIVAEAVAGGNYTNRILRVNNSGRYWYTGFFDALSDAVDGDTVYVYGGIYSETGHAGGSGSNVHEVDDLSIIGVGSPRINIAIPATNVIASGIRFSVGSTNLLVKDIDFYITSNDTDTNKKYGFIVSGVTNAVIDGCRIQWDCSSSGNTDGNKTFVAVSGATNIRVRNSSIVTRDLGTGNLVINVAAHNSSGVVFDNCTFVTENVDADDTGDLLSTYSSCVANDLSLYLGSEAARADQKPNLATQAEVNNAMIVGSSSDLTYPGGFDLVQSVYSKNDETIVIGEGLSTIVGVQGHDYTCIPADFSGTIFVLPIKNPTSAIFKYGLRIDVADNVTWHFKFLGHSIYDYGPTSPTVLCIGNASNVTLVVEGLKTRSAKTGGNYTVWLKDCIDSTVTTIDCDFAFAVNATKMQTVYSSGTGNFELQKGGRVMTTDQDWSYGYGLKTDDVLVYTNGTWLADPDYVKSDF